MASVTITTDDVADPNIVNDFLAAIKYTGNGGAAAKQAAVKADLILYIKNKVIDYRRDVAGQAAVDAVPTNIPIT